MTNSEWIRSMTDEELSKFLAPDMHIACYHCDRHVSNGGDLECSKCYAAIRAFVLFEWLSKEYVPESADGGCEKNES